MEEVLRSYLSRASLASPCSMLVLTGLEAKELFDFQAQNSGAMWDHFRCAVDLHRVIFVKARLLHCGFWPRSSQITRGSLGGLFPPIFVLKGKGPKHPHEPGKSIGINPLGFMQKPFLEYLVLILIPRVSTP